MNKEELENTRLKYQKSLDLFASEGQIQWSRYNTMLLINTIIIGLSSFNKDFPQSFKILFWLSPLIGFLLCYFWHRMTERGFIWMNHWITEANDLERQLRGTINPLQNGDKLRSKIESKVTENASLTIIKIVALLYVIMAIIIIGPLIVNLK
jgi:hypothetical protein